MLKVVVFDSGFGGELFADLLERELPVIEVIRVIDWRNAEEILKNAKKARKMAEAAIRPYIGRADLVILANYLVATTSLRYLRRKYPEQKFLGFNLPRVERNRENKRKGLLAAKPPILILATKALTRTVTFCNFTLKMERRAVTLCLDEWAGLIDDGELTREEIEMRLAEKIKWNKEMTREIILCAGQFNDIKPALYKIFGQRTKIYDSFNETVVRAGAILGLRGVKQKKS